MDSRPMNDEAETIRSLKSFQIPNTPKKMPRKQIFTVQKRTVVLEQSMSASFSDELNRSSGSLMIGAAAADDSSSDCNEDEMPLSELRWRSASFSADDNDDDSPWHNGQFKSPKEIVSYYRQLGDWWNVLPKTDFTYDERSKWYRKEIAPGIPVIPNFARPPLHPVQHKSRFNFFSRSSGPTLETTTSTNGKSQFSRFPILQKENKSLWSKVADFVIDMLLGLLCLPYDLLFGSYKSPPPSGRTTKSKYAWWTAPFRWTYKLMMILFAWEIFILVSVRQFFGNFRLQTALKIFALLSIISAAILAYVHYGVELTAIPLPSINITDFHNFTTWDYSGAIEMLKPLNMTWAYDQYANLVNIGWIYD